MERNNFISQFRGLPIGETSSLSSVEEHFQNHTLRPILRMQNDLLIAVFQSYCFKNKSVFFSLNISKKNDYIENAIQKDMKFRNAIKGIVIGLFTIDEYNEYSKIESSVNKRIMNLVIERLKSQLQLLV